MLVKVRYPHTDMIAVFTAKTVKANFDKIVIEIDDPTVKRIEITDYHEGCDLYAIEKAFSGSLDLDKIKGTITFF